MRCTGISWRVEHGFLTILSPSAAAIHQCSRCNCCCIAYALGETPVGCKRRHSRTQDIDIACTRQSDMHLTRCSAPPFILHGHNAELPACCWLLPDHLCCNEYNAMAHCARMCSILQLQATELDHHNVKLSCSDCGPTTAQATCLNDMTAIPSACWLVFMCDAAAATACSSICSTAGSTPSVDSRSPAHMRAPLPAVICWQAEQQARCMLISGHYHSFARLCAPSC